jgi:hypothetical protein
LLFIFEEDGGGYGIVRGSIEVEESGDAADITAAGTIVAPDGTVLVTEEPFAARYRRIRVAPIEAAGTPFEGLPKWTPPTTPTP